MWIRERRKRGLLGERTFTMALAGLRLNDTADCDFQGSPIKRTGVSKRLITKYSTRRKQISRPNVLKNTEDRSYKLKGRCIDKILQNRT